MDKVARAGAVVAIASIFEETKGGKRQLDDLLRGGVVRLLLPRMLDPSPGCVHAVGALR